MAALIVFSLLILFMYKGYCFSLNFQLAKAGIPRQAKARGFLVQLYLGTIPLRFELQSF